MNIFEDRSDASSQAGPPSSPLGDHSRPSKTRKAPPITPRRFTRFFTPRSSQTSPLSGSARVLRDLTASGLNTRDGEAVFNDIHELRPSKRRRIYGNGDESSRGIVKREDANSVPASSPLRSSPCPHPSPLQSDITCANISSNIARISRGRTHFRFEDCRADVSGFYSKPEDQHQFRPPDLPFSIATCNTNSLAAIGDEAGSIRLLETAKDELPGFSTSFLQFTRHSNAIMALEFSSDDSLLASSAGDQLAKITDMRTQKEIYVLKSHTKSVKQVTFQPGNDQILATCSRGNEIALWDLRCNHQLHQPVSHLGTPSSSQEDVAEHPGVHTTFTSSETMPHRSGRTSAAITTLRFLPAPRQHYLVSASDTSANLRIWDIRCTSRRHNPSHSNGTIPVSITQPPPLLTRRAHGTSSLAFSADSARLYTVSKDSHVYAYSTRHLILGQESAQAPRWNPTKPTDGAGPLYAMRHAALRVSSFFVQCAVRRPALDGAELLAVGSSDSCAVVFPTDERVLDAGTRHTRGGLCVYECGTALVRGHEREVTGIRWTVGGELLSLSDDFTARVWRDGNGREGIAMDLRTGGEGEGRRFGCGWADVDEEWDEEDG